MATHRLDSFAKDLKLPVRYIIKLQSPVEADAQDIQRINNVTNTSGTRNDYLSSNHVISKKKNFLLIPFILKPYHLLLLV
jgi:hypothetical protein